MFNGLIRKLNIWKFGCCTKESSKHIIIRRQSGFFGYFLKRTFLLILSLLICVISAVREIGGNHQSQSVVPLWSLGGKWFQARKQTGEGMVSGRRGFTYELSWQAEQKGTVCRTRDRVLIGLCVVMSWEQLSVPPWLHVVVQQGSLELVGDL